MPIQQSLALHKTHGPHVTAPRAESAWESSAAMGEVFLWAGSRDDSEAGHTSAGCCQKAVSGRREAGTPQPALEIWSSFCLACLIKASSINCKHPCYGKGRAGAVLVSMSKLKELHTRLYAA